MRHFYVYILTNKSQTLYIGITNDIDRRLVEHRTGVGSVFTAKYRCHTLVWLRRFNDAREAIATEKQLKGWTRAKKIALIEEMNPTWSDLSLPEVPSPPSSSFGRLGSLRMTLARRSGAGTFVGHLTREPA